MTKEPHTPRSSSLARIQQGLVLTAAALILAAIVLMARGHAAWGLALLVALTTGHAAAIALELALAARVNRVDPLPRPTFAEWLHAWKQEVRVAVQVFAWRQPFRWARHPDRHTKAAAAHPPRGADPWLCLQPGILVALDGANEPHGPCLDQRQPRAGVRIDR